MASMVPRYVFMIMGFNNHRWGMVKFDLVGREYSVVVIYWPLEEKQKMNAKKARFKEEDENVCYSKYNTIILYYVSTGFQWAIEYSDWKDIRKYIVYQR